MGFDRDRYGVFNCFLSGGEGHELRCRIHDMVLARLSGPVSEIDPNWHSVDFEFFDFDSPQVLLQRPASHPDVYRAEFDYSLESVTLVGPKVGHLSLTDKVFEIVPEPLVLLMRALDVFKPWFHTVHNPSHKIEIIEGKTVIEFENCTRGVVAEVRGDEFEVTWLDGAPNGLVESQKRYTRARLEEEFKMDGYCGQAVDVSYLPFLSQPSPAVEA